MKPLASITGLSLAAILTGVGCDKYTCLDTATCRAAQRDGGLSSPSQDAAVTSDAATALSTQNSSSDVLTSTNERSQSSIDTTFSSSSGDQAQSSTACDAKPDCVGSNSDTISRNSEVTSEIGTDVDSGSGVCGDGAFDPGEACDDGNTESEAACAYGEATCVACDASCSEVLQLTGPTCGDREVSDDEACDTEAEWCRDCRVVAQVSAGFAHTCALVSTGEVKCWGDGGNGQLGNGKTEGQTTPVAVLGLAATAIAIESGNAHSCALLADGRVKCWGGGSNGELGNGASDYQSTPVTVSGVNDAIAIAAGGYHSCALLENGAVKCWGLGSWGQLGFGATESQLSPVNVVSLGGKVLAISAGTFHTCALLEDASVKCWGGDDEVLTPEAVTGLAADVVALSAGNGHTCVVMTNGSAKCWGQGSAGQLGNGSKSNQLEPVDVSNLGGEAIGITAGDVHTCALVKGGTVRCWGQAGWLGVATEEDQTQPVTVSDVGAEALAVTAGGQHTCALVTGGSVRCWGRGLSGQLGNGKTEDADTPVSVVGVP